MCCSRWDNDESREKTAQMGWASPEHGWTEASSANENTGDYKLENPLEWGTSDLIEACCRGKLYFWVLRLFGLGVWRWLHWPCPGQGTDLALCVWQTSLSHLRFHLDEMLLWEISCSWIQADVFCAAEKSLQCFFQCSANEGESVFYLCYHGKLTTIQAVIYR